MTNQPAGHRIVPGARRPSLAHECPGLACLEGWLRPLRTFTGGGD